MRLDGSVAFEAQISSFSRGFYSFTEGDDRDMRYGIMNATGEVIVDPINERLNWSKDGHHVAETELSFKVIDNHGTERFNDLDGRPLMRNWAGRPTVFKPDTMVGYFNEGFAIYRKDDRTGFIHKTGRVAVERRFASSSDFRNGLARVYQDDGDRQENRIKYIDTSGEVVFSNH